MESRIEENGRALLIPSKLNESISAPKISLSTTTRISVTALDAIVNVNSLFSVAIFIGLSFTAPVDDQQPTAPAAAAGSRCSASPETIRNLLLYEIVSFSFFLFSSLIAQALKLGINIANSKDRQEASKAHVSYLVLKYGMCGSGLGSVVGCFFLMLSIVHVIEVKLGVLACGGKTVYAVVTLVVLVGTSLAAYVFISMHSLLQKLDPDHCAAPTRHHQRSTI